MVSRSTRRRGVVAALSIAAASVALHLLIVAGLALQGGPRMPERASIAPRVVDATLLRPAPPAPPPAAPPPAAAPPAAAAGASRKPDPPARPKAASGATPAAKPATVREPAPRVAPAASAATATLPARVAPDPTDFGAGPVHVAVADPVAQDGSAAPSPETETEAEAGGAQPSPTDGSPGDGLGNVAASPPVPGEAGRNEAGRNEAGRNEAAGSPDAAGTGALAGVADAERAPLPPLPGSHARRFRVYWGDYTEGRAVARLEYRLEIDGDRYEIRTEAEAEGLISLVYSGTLTQVSRGRHGPDGLEPLRYAEQRGKRAERSVAFDRDARQLLPVGRPPVPLPRGTQDRLSVFYQLGLLARADPAAFSAGGAPVVPVASLREVQMQRFEVIGDETLMAPGGPLRTLHLRRPSPSGSDDPEIDVWLGYDLEMLPVRLRIQDSGRRVLDQLIEREG